MNRRTQLELMVRGSQPPMSRLNDPLFTQAVSYTGGMRDEWKWNFSFNDITTKDLDKILTICQKG